MTWQSIESKMFTAAAYEAEPCVLYLRFTSGDVYRYFDFPAEQWLEFLAAESRGRFFLDSIRDRFPFERMAKLEAV